MSTLSSTAGTLMNEEGGEVLKEFKWTALSIAWAIGLFCVAGVAEIVGGWMVWAAIRGNTEIKTIDSSSNETNINPEDNTNKQEQQQIKANHKKPWWFAILGSLLLVTYGFLPCLQPTDSFGRIYAIYGGFFIVLSFLFGWALDGDVPDWGDIVGGIVALVGVLLIMFWPR